MDLDMNIRRVLPALSCILPPKNSLSWNDLSTIKCFESMLCIPVHNRSEQFGFTQDIMLYSGMFIL